MRFSTSHLYALTALRRLTSESIISQSISDFYSGLRVAAECHNNTVRQQLQYNIWVELLEQIKFQLAPKGRQRISPNDVRVELLCYVIILILACLFVCRPTVCSLCLSAFRVFCCFPGRQR